MDNVLLAAALLPAAALMWYVYRKDGVEKEPPRLIARMLLLGVVAGPIAIVLELVLTGAIDRLPVDGLALTALENFIGVALAEEGLKFIFLNTVKNDREFDYVFDGIVYGVSVSLGFAALENVLYVLDGGLGVAVVRALLSVPGHCAGGVLMGLLFGLAKKREVEGNKSESTRYYWLALILPTIEHGFYDMALSSDDEMLALLGIIVEVAFIVGAFILVNHISKHDQAIYGPGYQSFDWRNQPGTGAVSQPMQQAYGQPGSIQSGVPLQGYTQPGMQPQGYKQPGGGGQPGWQPQNYPQVGGQPDWQPLGNMQSSGQPSGYAQPPIPGQPSGYAQPPIPGQPSGYAQSSSQPQGHSQPGAQSVYAQLSAQQGSIQSGPQGGLQGGYAQPSVQPQQGYVQSSAPAQHAVHHAGAQSSMQPVRPQSSAGIQQADTRSGSVAAGQLSPNLQSPQQQDANRHGSQPPSSQHR